MSREVVPTGVLAAGGSIVALGVGTYLSYLLLTEFDGAAKAFGADRGTRGKSDISLITVERRP